MADFYSVSTGRAAGAEMVVDNGTSTVTLGGSGLTPVELMLGAIGTCMLATVVDYAERNEITTEGLRIDVSGTMANKPRRVETIEVVLHLPEGITSQRADALERVAHHCPVHTTIAGGATIDVTRG